jgi:type IV secretory pathway VirJ component
MKIVAFYSLGIAFNLIFFTNDGLCAGPQALSAFEKDQQITVNSDSIKNIPVILTNAKTKNPEGPVALLISGDGGWFSFEQKIADQLASIGIPTIGLDARKYFWNRKTPDQTAHDMAKVLSYYSKVWNKKQYLLIGYSLGSEIIPFVVNRLPVHMRSMIVSAVLLSPENYTDFEIHISNMLGMGNNQNTYNVIQEILRMTPVNTLLIFGDGEKSKLPGLLAGKPVRISIVPGDHHYKSNVQLILQTMKNNNAY